MNQKNLLSLVGLALVSMIAIVLLASEQAQAQFHVHSRPAVHVHPMVSVGYGSYGGYGGYPYDSYGGYGYNTPYISGGYSGYVPYRGYGGVHHHHHHGGHVHAHRG